jgi:hypothetical protein
MAAIALSYHLHTLFLFTKSDVKTLIPPVVRDVRIALLTRGFYLVTRPVL